MPSSEGQRPLQCPVQVPLILVDGLRPVVVLLQAILLDLPEQVLLLVIHFESLVEALLEVVLFEAGEKEPGGGPPIPLLVPEAEHRVLQASCLVDHRHGAIGLCIHLWKATGLVLARHQQEVAARHHAMLDFGVEAHVAADAASVGVLGVGELRGVHVIALAHQDHLDPAQDAAVLVGEQPGDDLRDQMHALLKAQATTEAEQSSSRVFVETQRTLQIALAMHLAL
mmetsp:Transcript_77631/g.186221  ORF Transcript_77631/g.186221 Transcript_77631/m.186221 type:complete len:226 (+) Transcript_77631:347-1024(+)